MHKLSKKEDNILSTYVGVMVFAGCCVFADQSTGVVEVFGWLTAVVASAIFALSGYAAQILHKLTR